MDIKVNYNAIATPRTNDQAERFGFVEGSASGRLVRRILQFCGWLFAVLSCWLFAVLCGWLFAVLCCWMFAVLCC
jgi:hypothetical protein